MAGTRDHISRPAHYLVRAAVTAPSLHNSQPWLFVARDDVLELYADPARRLRTTDPGGRELTVSCGAALFNVRLAMRHLGFRPLVRACDEPGRRNLLAEIRWGPYEPPGADEELLHRALTLRHTHRGPFLPGSLPEPLLRGLAGQCRAEGALLRVVADAEGASRIAEAVREAETVWRADPSAASEIARWAPVAAPVPEGEERSVHPAYPDGTAFAGRDYTGRSRHGCWREPVAGAGAPGAVVVLATRRDDRRDRLLAGQALQRMLLAAAAYDVRAAFHTQPLEIPALRERLRRTVTFGFPPQVVLRLGRASGSVPTARRPAAEVLSGIASAGPVPAAAPRRSGV
ncbi:Acg family FMN-binding oxidoreductase [Streptomyces sp. NPDC048172]|uniref:Acg family FMN-binding oxidoreductase n=1 Tax=Streptomyces sp. NPDC048172 TaxID=3365505 RepID=UPI003720E36E